MNSSDDDVVEEDEGEWTNTFTDAVTSEDCEVSPAASGSRFHPKRKQRVILHFDLDCFYAQVEMIRNPALRNVPLGVQQKYIIVTCNYVARDLGVKKLMSVKDAKEKCPQLVLVNGEDLTNYRDISYKVTELLMSFCPLVERLGFDENFIDVTEMVEKMLADTQHTDLCFKGHVYDANDADAGQHPSLALGSQVAARFREAVHLQLGLTGCAGVASNKLLAKLVSGAFKPDQQTTLLPENTAHLMARLGSLRGVPGVGHQTAKRLQALGLVSVQDLQLFPLADLAREFPGAERLKDLAEGVDDSAVTPSGAPQSLSDEDSFKKISSSEEVTEKIQQLLHSLVKRMHKDGRLPQTIRLTIRRFSATNKWFSRESRQCPIPNHVGQKISSVCSDDAIIHLIPLAMKLFHKMVDTNASFHLTLINVCFSNLQAGTKSSIKSFFSKSPRGARVLSSQAQSSGCGPVPGADNQFSAAQEAAESPRSSEPTSCPFGGTQSESVPEDDPSRGSCSSVWSRSGPQTGTHGLPPHVDPEVFGLLPADIQEELLASEDSRFAREAADASEKSQLAQDSSPGCREEAEEEDDDAEKGVCKGGRTMEVGASSLPEPPFPLDVDPKVFSELPPDLQRELRSEWKQRKPVLKTASSKKSGRRSSGKDRKTVQTNNLFKYFKPG